MKSVFSVLLVLFLFVGAAFAHPGKTDSNGGHKNHSTGEYHYHHGYSAHQHIDGMCPYDFDDKTSRESGANTSAKQEIVKEKTESRSKEKPLSKIVFAIAMLILICFYGWVFIVPILTLFSGWILAFFKNAFMWLWERIK
jgi:hypothetical protein